MRGNVNRSLPCLADDDWGRFALRPIVQSLGISLPSATEPIDDTSTAKLMDGVLAAFAQKAALKLGRRVFLAPVGYQPW